MKQFKGPKYQRGFLPALGWVAAAITGGSAIAGHRAAKKGAKAQRRANEAQREVNRLRNLQNKRQFLRQFRQAQAMSLMGGVGAGVGLESSRVQSQLSSQMAQANTAIREFNRMDELGDTITAQMNAQSKYGAQQAGWSALGSFASQFIKFPAGQAPIEEIDTSGFPQKKGLDTPGG